MAEKKPYKVVLESLTTEKKKLKSTVIYDEQAPPGYTFCPIGAPELAHYCKELSRKRGVDIGIVSTRPKNLAHRDPTNVSHHIHRVGYHFRNDVFDVAFTQLGLKGPGSRRTLRPRGADNRIAPTAIARRMDSYGASMGVAANESAQERQKRMVSLAIKDLFPKIPDDDQKAIIARAFQEGSDRIGTQESIPLPRRVQLAVLAHVRHTKTDYDNLLKTVGWQGARRLVEQSCLDQIVRWRGETDEGDGELEDIFQEVIVLDDDDDDDTQDLSDRHGHESSVEIIADQRHPEDVDVDAYSPPPLTTRQSIPREPPRSESPAIISVKPIRAPRPPPLLTRDAFNQRLQDTKQRVGHEHGDAPLLSLNGQPRAVVAQSHEGQASDKRQMPAVNGFRYVSDSAAALERSHHDSSSHPEAPRRPPQPQVYRSIEGQSDQQRRGWRPEAMQTGLPQRSLPGLNPMPRHSGNPTPRERSPPHNKPMTALAEHVGTRNGYHARDEVPSQRVPRPLRAGRDREVIDLTRTSPVATKAAADMRVNTRPTSVTRPRTRSRSPDRRPMYYERALRPVEDTRDGRYLAYPQYRDRMDPPHRQPLSGIESNGQRLYEIDAVGRRLQDYAMYDDNDDDVRRPPRRLRELQQAPPRSRSAGHHVLREEPERLHDHDIRYADRATRSRQYLPLEDWEPSTVRYRDMGDPYPVDRRPM